MNNNFNSGNSKKIIMLGVTGAALLILAGGIIKKRIDKKAKKSEIIQYGMVDITPDDSHVKMLGRGYYKDKTLWLDHSGSGAEFYFTESRCVIYIAGDDEAKRDKFPARVAVYVNDERVDEALIEQKEKSFSIENPNPQKPCKVTVVKLTEAKRSMCGISGICINSNGKIYPSEEKSLKIEFVGDSITCGYGVEDSDPSHGFSSSTEDVTKSYALKACEKLDADYSVVAFSGYGVASGFSDSGVLDEEETVPKYYTKFGYCSNSFDDVNWADDVEWDFEKFTPDIVVINLGTNDVNWAYENEENTEQFVKAYVEMLKLIREKNPEAEIIASLGIMGNMLYPAVREAVAQYEWENEDNIFLLEFDEQKEEDGYAANFHPSEISQEKAAEQLVNFIELNLK